MKHPALALIPLLLIVTLPGAATQARVEARPAKPPVPKEMAPGERGLLMHAASLISRRQFKEAAGLLQPLLPPATVQVYVDWTPVPKASRAAYRGAVQQALDGWNAALGNPQRFQWTTSEEDADLLVLFEKAVAILDAGQVRLTCSEMRLDGQPPHRGEPPTRRTARLRLALCVPHLEVLHSPASITHLVGQGLGAYLGLGPSANLEDVMGPDTHGEELALKPSTPELRMLQEIEQARLRLWEHAQNSIALQVPVPALTVEKMEMDAGEVRRGDTARFAFAVRNTGDAPLEIHAKPNCDCVIPNYDRTILPGAVGKIEAEMHTTGLRGPAVRLIEVTSNDPQRPVIHLRLTAKVKSILQVLPTESPIIGLKDHEATVKEFEIRVTGKEPLEIKEVLCGAPYAAGKAELLPEVGTDRRYRLQLTLQPNAPAGRSSFVVTVLTTSPREPNLILNVICEKGIVVTPPSLYLGTLQQALSEPVVRTVTLQKRGAAFRIHKVTSEDPNLEVAHEAGPDNSEYRIKVTYRGGWPIGTRRTKVVVETDDSSRPKVEIPVLASVSSDEEPPR